MQVELVVDVLEVTLDRAHAEGQLRGDGGVVGTARGEREHLELARGEHVARVVVAGVGSVLGQELGDLAEEDRPGRLVLEHDVVVAVERDESRAGDA